MANIIYRLSKRNINGRHEVMLRFYHNGIDQRAHSRVFVPAELWDAKKQRLAAAKRYVTADTLLAAELQAKLDAIEQEVMARFISDQYTAVPGWLQRTVDSVALAHILEPGRKQMITAEQACIDYADTSDIDDSTKRVYMVLARSLERFAKANRTLYMNTLSVKDIEDLQKFLATELPQGRSHNTIVSRMRKLRTVCNWAVRKGILGQNPFGAGGFALKQEVYGTPTTLSIQEVEQIYRADMPSERLSVQRDIFVFQCYVGQRISDLRRMTGKNIIQTAEGLSLQYVQEKTRRQNPRVTEVPLSSTAVEILEKYKTEQKDGRILPFISEQNYNYCIKDILRIAGITRLVSVLNTKTFTDEYKPICDIASSHLARRTFISNVYEVTQEERLTISLTGHAEGSRALDRYIHIKDSTKRSVIDRLGK